VGVRLACRAARRPRPSHRTCLAASSILDELVGELEPVPAPTRTSDAELLEDDEGVEGPPPAAVRDRQEVAQLFREGSGRSAELSFEQLAGISEIASLIEDGDLTVEELCEMWAATPKEGDFVDISGFGGVLARIDALFEPDDDAVTERYMVPPGAPITELTRQAVRKAVQTDRWVFRCEKATAMDPLVQPPLNLPGGAENPLSDLGECGATGCQLNRMQRGCEHVRPEFLEFCVRNILQRVDTSAGIIYASFGCGCLYGDWELLERLVNVEGVKVKEAWLVENQGMEFKAPVQARSAFASWFSHAGIKVRAFDSAETLSGWMNSQPSGEQASVLMECDVGDCIITLPVQQTVLHPGGVHLILTQEEDAWANHSVVRKLYQKSAEDPREVRLLDSKILEDGSWVDRDG